MNDKRNRKSGRRPKKCRFRGNQHIKKDMKSKAEANPNKSASFKKLSVNESSQLPTNDSERFRFIDISIFKDFEKSLCCSTCFGTINIIETANYGFSSSFKIACQSCNIEKTWRNSKMVGIKKNVPTINRRAVFAMRMIGKGAKSLQKFSSYMALPAPVSQKSYDKINDKIPRATTVVANSCMKKAAEEELLTGSSDIMVSGDGTWKTRGHSSLVGVCTVIGAESEKVIDIDVMSSYRSFKKNCIQTNQNPVISNGSRIMLSDGDASTFKDVCEDKPYGINTTIEKVECVGHVQKRMGTRLRKLKKRHEKEKIADGKTIGGRGRLTDELIKKLTTYYGNAIRKNKNNLFSMRKDIWAIWMHFVSTDADPQHHFCPTGENSWCKYNQAKFKNSLEMFKHKSSFPRAVMDMIKPIFKALSNLTLLKRCLGGKTQNTNESLNSLIWHFCSKNTIIIIKENCTNSLQFGMYKL
ncbi:hypothetical protein AVEN_266038-1 [Araneus ventricosus]|uniref:Mutator-like transposase domain-containing protein n=1 Tax=Araneus ventricosus TaxID=182803 RepID=A0A4Y2S686_ARAVE|nr:hypothetical protein AVEN_266038-1 [Araneus ventricosus]